jgi:hypothetical protein
MQLLTCFDVSVSCHWVIWGIVVWFLFFNFPVFFSKEVNEEVGPKGERGRNPFETAMHPSPPLQDMCGS